MTEQTGTTTSRFQTRYTEVELFCRKCHAKWSPVVANFINFGTDPKGREGILRKTIHHGFCPVCKTHVDIDHVFAVYDPDENLVVQVRLPWEFRAGGGEEMYWTRLEQFILDWADEDVRVDVAFGIADLIEKHLGGQAAVDAALERSAQEREEGLAAGSLVGDAQRSSTA
ncbi:MAG TPA: CpXC domain-containing protein [Thermomicrobiales bacterium]|nr:CpXC domain-containing protein [Thermomicrobiales bacterium]